MTELTDIAGAEKSGCGTVRVDAGLRILSLDDAAGALLGKGPDELVGALLTDAADLGGLIPLMKSGVAFVNQNITAANRTLACDFVPLTEGESMVGGVLLLRLPPHEVTGHHEDLRELVRSASAYLNLDYDGIIIVDRQGVVLMVNQAFAEIMGTVPQAMIGKHLSQAYTNSQPSRLPEVMASGLPQIGIVHYLDGKQVYASLYPLRQDGEVIGGIGKILFKDIREITLIANRLQSSPETRALAGSVPRKESTSRYDINSIVGQSCKMLALKETLLRIAGRNSNVLLRGESGTGKELFAHAIHAASSRRYGQFVKVNCAAIPEHLLESELFGYSEGAFTGAKKGGQIGKFEQAHNGTIFLDEIGDMPLYMQAKMLRVLQEKELTQLGGGPPKTIDLRVVAATNCDLEALVKEGKFREDLYYRLKVVTLFIPSLRERKEDIRALVESFILQFNQEFGLAVEGLSLEAREILMRYDWPGNVRELRNVIESAFNLVNGPLILKDHLPVQLANPLPEQEGDGGSVDAFIRERLGRKSLCEMVDEFEKRLLAAAIEQCCGNKLHAAEMLGISRQWLYKKLHKSEGDSGPPESE
ncbi:MAG TPA: sigma 54-interacting transcriptional regulator [Geomonas sp.]|nr:sigma 54-interacting transcriptional regulator [Geomonas sp.]